MKREHFCAEGLHNGKELNEKYLGSKESLSSKVEKQRKRQLMYESSEEVKGKQKKHYKLNKEYIMRKCGEVEEVKSKQKKYYELNKEIINKKKGEKYAQKT